MVEIWLTRATSFQYRQLVWVSGVLALSPGRPDTDKAVYALTNAIVDRAAEHDIERWFTP
jgi:2C-methyl-D-erythritol 2,4-cyclodiphosphate synthase